MVNWGESDPLGDMIHSVIKHVILDCDFYNFDEIGFIIGIINIVMIVIDIE